MKTRKKFHIPIYDAVLWIVVAEDIESERRKMEHIFGPLKGTDFVAICSEFQSKFGLFFEPSALTIETIAHEVFHLTHRILEWKETNFDAAHHEHAAYLHGYLMDLVMKNIKLCH